MADLVLLLTILNARMRDHLAAGAEAQATSGAAS